MTVVHQAKQEIRNKMKARRAQLTLPEQETYSRQAAECFLRQDFYQNASVLFGYASFQQEIQTQAILQHAMLSGKRVALPKVHGCSMTFYYIRSWDELRSGYRGIPEPPETNPVGKEVRSALLLMPGLAFDQEFHRMGYGAGFYDAYLAKWQKAVSFYKAALAYEFQVLDRIAAEPHDIPVDAIVTPAGVRRRSNGAIKFTTETR